MTVHYSETSEQAQRAVRVTPERASKKPYRNGGKRVLDIVIVLLTAPFVVPIIAILALLIARDGANPFYVQSRVGAQGKLYKMWKLRSMVVNAESKLEAYLASNADARAEWVRDQKLKSDPRITRFGKLLRRSSMDELPQLWNVLRGDMSLVGPRPMMPSQQAIYPGHDYYELRPGITGSWQVSERNESTFADRAAFDTAYNKDLSLAHDTRILAATVRVVLKATGY
ncbi:sugar transferase (plasmid) [Pseudorhodobacter turbinis]|uniref:Sugar transferase n=1 Tax=Pseudorhodobacter turbinis TaxID=2500533 RepID=A0A4P8ELY1_9RHOB|nr:sugar transferase [Pseudorhodobacter turbinis]QCO58106.1 sugar transferase [Pseudorhodobacter turbinis]